MELVVITWDSDQKSGRHGHPEGGCIFKVLQGSINEEFYKTMNPEDNYEHLNKHTKDNVGYIDNTLGYHLVHNVKDNVCVSLHVYSPPFEHGCE